MVTHLKFRGLLGGALALLAGSAAHAEDCATPQFNAQQHVYLSGTLKGDSDLLARLDGLSDELMTAANANGQQIIPYFVACEKGYNSGVPGVDLAQRVFGAWRLDSSFPWQSRVVVIGWVRNGFDQRHGSVGADAGKPLADLGFTGDYFASPNGPVLGEIRRFMPNDPKGEFVNIIRRINSSIEHGISTNRSGGDLREGKSADPEDTRPYLVIGLFMLFLFFYMQSDINRSSMQSYYREPIRSAGAEGFRIIGSAEADLLKLADSGPLASVLSTEAKALRSKLTNFDDRTADSETAKKMRALVEEIEQFQKKVTTALLISKSTVGEIETGIANARAAVANQRAKVVEFAFPGAATEREGELFKLAELEEPNELIARAEAALTEVKRLLDEGLVAEAESQCDRAKNLIKRVDQLVKETLSAKTNAEEIVSLIGEAKGRLLDSCANAVAAREALRSSEFAPVNYADVEDSIEAGRQLADGVEAVVKDAAQLYLDQKFVAASALLDELRKNLDEARRGAESLSSRLADLREKRASISANLPSLRKKMEKLGAKKAPLESRYDELHAATRDHGTTVLNWLLIYEIYRAVTSETASISAQIDAGRLRYDGESRSSGGDYSGGGYNIGVSASYGGDSFGGGAGGGNY